MIKTILAKLFVNTSKMLRYTSLRHIPWISRLHIRLYEYLGTKDSVSLAGFTLATDPRDRAIAKKLALYGDYEAHMRELLLSYARPGSIVIDIGANIGLHTIPLAKQVNHTGKVIAFEPDPDNYKILLKNLKTNHINNVVVYNAGLSSKSGAALLYQSDINRGGLSLCKSNVESRNPDMNPVSIELLVGDLVLKEYCPSISLIKIDVEGAEPLVIEGLKNTLTSNPDIAVVFEYSPEFIGNFGYNPKEILEFFQENGFNLSVINEEKRTSIPMDAEDILRLGERSGNALNVAAVKCKDKPASQPDNNSLSTTNPVKAYN